MVFMRNHEFKQIIHSLFNLTGIQKRELLDVVESEMNRSQTETMIENIKDDVTCYPLAGTPFARFSSIKEADKIFFSKSFNGKQGDKRTTEDKIAVFIVKDRSGTTTDYVHSEHNNEAITEKLEPIVDKDSILCSDGAHAHKNFPKKHDIKHHRLIALDKNRVIGGEYHIQNINDYTGRLKACVEHFNGIGTAYLDNYIGWRRFLEGYGVKATKKETLNIVLNS